MTDVTFSAMIERYLNDSTYRAFIDARMARVARVIRNRHADRLYALGPRATDGQVVIAFNDHPFTSQDDIVAVMREARTPTEGAAR